jgi:hypothetical protein
MNLYIHILFWQHINHSNSSSVQFAEIDKSDKKVYIFINKNYVHKLDRYWENRGG